jgi:N-acetylmuramoyl-L-alanine amidase
MVMSCSRRIPVLPLVAALTLIPVGVARAEPPDVPVPKPAPSCDREDFRVVLDVGHTAESPGAMSARGVGEYEFNLRLAKRIDEDLIRAGFSKTKLMVTNGPGKKSLYARVAHANRLSPDLLLSIHHDSVPEQFKQEWLFDGKLETSSYLYKGHSIFVSDLNAQRKDSLAFANMLGEQLAARGLKYTPHYTERFMGRNRHTLLDAKAGVYRYDALFVLKKPRVPAVLLEAGSIVNRDEELELDTPARQEKIGAAVVDAVDSFCLAQSKPGPQILQSARSARHIRHRRAPRKNPVAAPIVSRRPSGSTY